MYISCSPSDASELKFSSVCPNLGQGTCLVLAGQQIPQRCLNPVNRPADAFMELQKSLGALSCTVYNGCLNKILLLYIIYDTRIMCSDIILINQEQIFILNQACILWDLIQK